MMRKGTTPAELSLSPIFSNFAAVWPFLLGDHTQSVIGVPRANRIIPGSYPYRHTVSKYGLGVVQSGTYGPVYGSGSLSPTPPSVYPICLYASFHRNATSGATQFAICLGPSGGTGHRYGIGATDGNIIGQLNLDNVTTITITGPEAINGRLYHACLISRSSTDHTLWVNGVSYTSTTDAVNAPNQVSRLGIGHWRKDTSGNNPLIGVVYSAAYGIRDPGDGALKQLSDDPWALMFWSPQESWINGTAAVAAGASIVGLSGLIRHAGSMSIMPVKSLIAGL